MRFAFLAFLLVLSACGGNAPSAPPPLPATRVTAGLAYTLTPPAGWPQLTETAKAKAWGTGSEGGGARLVLTRSSKVFLADDNVRKLVPEEMIRGLDQFRNVVVISTTPVTIDSMPGFQVIARALPADTDSSTPFRICCTSVFAADGAFYVLGYLETASTDSLEPIRTATATLTVK